MKKIIMCVTCFCMLALPLALRAGEQTILGAIQAGDVDGLKKLVSIWNVNTPINSYTPLCRAVMENKPAIVRALNALGADPNAFSQYGTLPLHEAVDKGELDLVKAVLENKKTNVDIEKGKKTPLFCAVEKAWSGNENVDVIKALVERGANVNFVGDGRTPIEIAILRQKADVFAALLASNKADLIRKDTYGSTYLHLAAQKCFVEGVLQLLAKKVQLDEKDRNGKTPFFCATEKGCVAVMSALIKARANVNMPDNYRDTPLQRALNAEEPAVLQTLLSAPSVDLEGQDSVGRTPLLNAASIGNAAAITLLAKKGARLDAVDANGNNTLHLAVENNKPDAVKALVALAPEVGSFFTNVLKVNAKNKAGKTPLHLAVEKKQGEIVDALLGARGIDVNVQDKEGDTPLYAALKVYNKDLVSKLLATNKAKINLKNNALQTAVDLASYGFNASAGMPKVLEDYQSKIKNLLFDAVQEGNVDAIKELVGLIGYDPSWYLLHVAAAANKPRSISALLGLAMPKINVEEQNADGDTAWLVAVKAGAVDALEALDRGNADVYARTKSGDNSLVLAVKEKKKEVVGYLLTLKRAGELPYDLSSALTAAIQTANEELIDTLVTAGALRQAEKGKKEQFARTALQTGNVAIMKKVFATCGILKSPLVLAIEEKNVQAVQALVSSQEPLKLNEVDWDVSTTPLHFAVRSGDLAVLKALLEHHKELIETKDNRGKTLLMEAVAAKNPSANIVAYLLQQGAQVDAQDNSGCTALHYAISMNANNSHGAVMQKLIEAGADVNKPDIYGTTPVQKAVEKKNYSFVGAMFKTGIANIKFLERGVPSEFEFSVQKYREELDEKLVNAFKSGNKDDLQTVLGLGASPARVSNELVRAFDQVKDGTLIEFLVNNGFKIDSKDNIFGQTALYCAAQAGSLAVVSELLRRGASANVPDSFGCTPLYAAVDRGHSAVVKRILQVPGLPIDFFGKKSPFISALKEKNLPILRAFMPLVKRQFLTSEDKIKIFDSCDARALSEFITQGIFNADDVQQMLQAILDKGKGLRILAEVDLGRFKVLLAHGADPRKATLPQAYREWYSTAQGERSGFVWSFFHPDAALMIELAQEMLGMLQKDLLSAGTVRWQQLVAGYTSESLKQLTQEQLFDLQRYLLAAQNVLSESWTKK